MSDLAGKRVVVTRAASDFEAFARLLRQRSARPIPFPTIEIRPVALSPTIAGLLEGLNQFDWLVLTSANGVVSLAQLLGTRSLPKGLRLAAVGPKTAAAMRAQGWRVDSMPDEFRAAAILPGLGELAGKKVLLARGQLADPDLPRRISAEGGEVVELVVYHTRLHLPDERAMAALRKGVDAVTFTSASTVEGFVTALRSAGLDADKLAGAPRFAYIGPVTAAAADTQGLPRHIVAGEHTLEGLITALEDFFVMEIGPNVHE